MMYHSFNPAISYVIFPINDHNKIGQELFLSTCTDYSVGKLFRTGLDAVYGGSFDKRIYDSKEVRKNLIEIPDHRNLFEERNRGKKIVLSQGHGNLGLNNWAVGYVNEPESQPESPQFIFPTGEPVHERVYRSFMKIVSGDHVRYEIADIMYFYKKEGDENVECLPLDDVDKKIKQAPFPDREVDDNYVFLPVWNGGLKDESIEITPYYGIDYGKLNDQLRNKGKKEVQFAAFKKGGIKRECLNRIKIVKLNEVIPGDPEEYAVEEIPDVSDIKFAFFGIPVEGLEKEVSEGTTDDATQSSELARIVHYFYDLRHVFDLGGISAKEFYLFEHALKKNYFENARKFLRGDPGTLSINISELLQFLADQKADENVIGALYKFSKRHDDLKDVLVSKGYMPLEESPCNKHVSRLGYGRFCFEIKNNELHTVRIHPLRNVYPYSFIGIISSIETGQDYLLFAVTSGSSGVRSGYIGSKRIFGNIPLKVGFTLNRAVEEIGKQLSELRKSEQFQKSMNIPLDFTWEESKLLLLDQGGDVHQWLGSGGLQTVIGSSEKRALISSELIVAIERV
jgi:hypothetical protein